MKFAEIDLLGGLCRVDVADVVCGMASAARANSNHRVGDAIQPPKCAQSINIPRRRRRLLGFADRS
jgi:hypothetical protein